MRFWKTEYDGIIYSFGIGNGGIEINEYEFQAIKNAFSFRPKQTLTMDYRLRNDLTWEKYELVREGEDDSE